MHRLRVVFPFHNELSQLRDQEITYTYKTPYSALGVLLTPVTYLYNIQSYSKRTGLNL